MVGLDGDPPVRREDLATKPDGLVGDVADDADGGPARAVEGREQSALGMHCGRGSDVVQRGDELGGPGVVGADLEADRALCWGGREMLGVEIGCYVRLAA